MRAVKGKAVAIIVMIMAGLTITLVYFLIPAALDGYVNEKPKNWFSALAYATILFLLVLGFLTGTYEIFDKGITARSIYGKHRLLFENVVEVKILPLYGNTLLFGYNVVLVDFNGKNMTVFASYYANRHELVRAIMEGAKIYNPRVIISSTLINTYGHPPFRL